MNVKKGDLARIVKSTDGLNVGKIVEVGQYMGEHSKLGPIWHVRSRTMDLVTMYGAVGKECDCADDWLRPIRPDELDPSANDAHFDREAA